MDLRLFKKKSRKAEDYSRYRLSVRDFLREGSVGVIIAAAVSYTFYKSLFVFIISAPAAFVLLPFARKKSLRDARQWELTLEFREALWIMSGYMNAGLSPENALIKSIPELKRMYGEKSAITAEFERIAGGIGVNIPIERLFADFGMRSGVRDIRNFAEVFALVKRSGGNMRETVEKTTDIIRDKTAVGEEIKNITAARRYEQTIMNIIPFAIILYINISSGDFLDSMYESPAGSIIMTFCLLLIGVSYILSRKILDIKI